MWEAAGIEDKVREGKGREGKGGVGLISIILG